MMYRNSVVQTLKTQSVSFGGALQIGDSNQVTPVSYALAVQREYPLFFTNEGSFHYKIFKMKLPTIPITEKMKINIFHENPSIHVNHIDVLGVSSSGVVHIGSTRHIDAEARVKHIRHLYNE